MYSWIDIINHLSKNYQLKYRSRKYWYLTMLHAMSFAIVVAYNIYLQLAEGKLNLDWKVIYPVDFWTFRDLLSIQMLGYDAIKRRYPVDIDMRRCNNQKRRDQSGNKESLPVNEIRTNVNCKK